MAKAHVGEEEEECCRPAQLLKTSQDNEARGRTKRQKGSKMKKHHLLGFDLQARAEAFGRYSAVWKGISGLIRLEGVHEGIGNAMWAKVCGLLMKSCV